VKHLLLLAAIAWLLLTFSPKLLLAILVVWSLLSIGIGILIGKHLARRSRDYPTPRSDHRPSPHEETWAEIQRAWQDHPYDQDEGR